MYVEVVPNRTSRPAVLLREGWREQGTVRKRTLANLSDWPAAQVAALRAVLKGDLSAPAAPVSGDAFDIVRTRPHGHVVAALGTLRRLGLDALIAPRRSPERERVLAMIVARILEPGSKLARPAGSTARRCEHAGRAAWGSTPAVRTSSTRPWTGCCRGRQTIEAALAKRHLGERTLALYDVTSTYFEGRRCPLARFGHSRDGKRDKLQIVFGVLTQRRGVPGGRGGVRGQHGRSAARSARPSPSCASASGSSASSWWATGA